MAAPHWFPKLVNDWLNDNRVQAMTWEERGIYDHLLCVSWLQDPPGTLPANLGLLCRLSGINFRVLKRNLSGLIGECWVEESGRLINLKLFEIGQNQLVKIKQRKEAGRVGGLAKARNLLEQKASERPSESESESDSDSDSDSKSKESKPSPLSHDSNGNRPNHTTPPGMAPRSSRNQNRT